LSRRSRARVLFWLNWRLTTVRWWCSCSSAAGWPTRQRLRPIFRERGDIQAQITGRLAQSLGGVRVVKAYVAEDREQQIFSRGVYRLFDNIRKTITGISATTAGPRSLSALWRGDDHGRRPVDPVGR